MKVVLFNFIFLNSNFLNLRNEINLDKISKAERYILVVHLKQEKKSWIVDKVLNCNN